MPSLQDMRQRAQEAGLMKLDRLIANRQHIPTNEFPIPSGSYASATRSCIPDASTT